MTHADDPRLISLLKGEPVLLTRRPSRRLRLTMWLQWLAPRLIPVAVVLLAAWIGVIIALWIGIGS